MVVGGLLLAWALRRGRGDPPKHPVRRKIVEAVSAKHGINERALQETTGLKRGTVRHHLRLLVDSGILTRYPVGRENHYFPAGVERKRMDQVATANHGRAKRVLREIFLDPGIPQAELGERVGMTRKVLRHYIDFLGEHGLVEEQRDGRYQRYWPASSLDEAVYESVFRRSQTWQPAEDDSGPGPHPPEARRPERPGRDDDS